MFCYTDQVQSGHGFLLMTPCNYSYYCKEKINIRQVVKYSTKLFYGSCFIDVMCILTIANGKISFEVKFVQCMFIVYFELSNEAPYPSTR
jgi:hypothetical protein